MIPSTSMISFEFQPYCPEVEFQCVGECYIADTTGRAVMDDFGFLVESLPQDLMDGLNEFYGLKFPIEGDYDVTYRWH